MGPLYLLLGLASLAIAQLESTSIEIVTITGSSAISSGEAPAATVPSDFDGSTIATASLTRAVSGSTGATNATASGSSSGVSSEATYTQLVGGTRSSSTSTVLSATVTTSTAAPPVNTQPCNNYPEFCNRKYSNITEVCAHNSPFLRARNVGSNQELTVTQQLDDGIRVLQGQAHYINGTLYYCHTSCDLLNAGTVEDYLRTVTEWIAAHPFDVVTIIFGNYNWQDTDKNGNRTVTSKQFAEPIEASGLKQYVYQPPKTVMNLKDWPTLGELIISNKRVITFIDYNFDTAAVPYLLWEFYNIWETPFSPTSENFTCEIQRPDGLSENKSREMMYMANHNLNVQVSIAGLNLLIPNTAELNKTNGVNGSSSLGEMSQNCTGMWGRPPNFLLVDYYNYGSPMNGSVFEVAARANNVTYDRACCGKAASLGVILEMPSPKYLALAIAVVAALLL
ncbi:PLC-like phosphodiesterase [Karstenula rhodostoma CBS 690.94]|uniref:PLC-like phosphodiesterase n=1 Tax=Karstenula rhodostoma CBS 690.94 TaxID=1392251 RepID=A0A9P4PD02_9PLEO|nr:PLC-like phosphodiesterase [Karstenula rhodostoma CBS 690.94]